MRLLSRYVLRQIMGPSILAVLVFAVLGVANEIQERVSDLPIDQMGIGDISRLTLYFLPTLIAYIVPATYLMGILLAFGRLSQNGEIVAMKAAGVPLKRLVIPVILLGALLSGACFVIQDQVQPWAISSAYRLIFTELPLRVTLDSLTPGVMHEFTDWRVYIGSKDSETGALKDIVILKPEEESGRRASTHYADSARLVTENGQTKLEMTNCLYIPAGESGNVIHLASPSTTIPVPRPEAMRVQGERQALTIRQLYAGQCEQEKEAVRTKSQPVIRDLLKTRREIAERLSLPFACLAVSLAAAPLGARAKRSGRSYTFAVGFAIILTYYVLHVLVEPKSLNPLSVTILRYWIPNLVLGAAGVVFLWRVDRV